MTTLRSAPEVCVCLAVRQLARQLTQYYDQCLAPAGLSVGQLSILAKLNAIGPKSVAELAELLVLDRKSLGLALRPLERDGLVELQTPPSDRRRREIVLTREGRRRLAQAMPLWDHAQQTFRSAYGPERSRALRKTVREVIEAMEDAGLSRSALAVRRRGTKTKEANRS